MPETQGIYEALSFFGVQWIILNMHSQKSCKAVNTLLGTVLPGIELGYIVFPSQK
jgi:hypothetical protein